MKDLNKNPVVKALYRKFDVAPPDLSPKEIFRWLGAFWQTLALHRRICGKTNRDIISPFGPDCPYPVWHKDEWIKNADPPGADFDSGRPFFGQLWELFQKCPIPHNTGAGNQNCEYTDDWWYGKNCYLSHSGANSKDVYYCYRVVNLKDSQFCVFSFDSELCVDLINSRNCFNTIYALNSSHCSGSAFLFDCRNCSDCLFSWNLRNKQYCIFNKEYSKEEYEKERTKYDFSSRKTYEEAKQRFRDILREKAIWRDLYIVQCENCEGDMLEKCKNCVNCFLIQESEDCANAVRNLGIKDSLNVVSSLKSELLYFSCMAQDKCYDIRFCHDVIQCKYMEYSAYCFNSQHCFGCCGLVNKKYHIFNKPYSPEDYGKKVAEIKEAMKKEGAYGKFFPGHFAAIPYDESFASLHWPLSAEEQKNQGFRLKTDEEKRNPEHSPVSEIPDKPQEADESICKKVFWDEEAEKPFQITPFDLKFCGKAGVPLPNGYYAKRLKENYSMIFFSGELRETKCAETGVKILTAAPETLDGQIVSTESYLKNMSYAKMTQ